MRKRLLSILLACALMLLTACGGHAHSAATGWVSDLENHWHVCDECGENFESAAHALEDGVCTVCGSEIIVWEDGSSQLITYNEYGDYTQLTLYAADGSVESEERYEYEYGADGNKIREKDYTNGVLACEYEYAQNTAGETYIAKDTYYYEDGTKSSSEYDATGNILHSASYAADGSMESAYEYEYSDDGSWMSEKEYYGNTLSAVREYSVDTDGWQKLLTEKIYNEDGSWIGTEYDLYDNVVIEIESDADGNVTMDRRYEYTYDADGNYSMSRIYENGVLTEEVEYFTGSDEEGSWSMSGKTTVYHEDGSKTISDRDLEATWSSETTYDANGNVVEELRYEYEYNEDGDSIGSKGYKNGKLIEEMRSIIGADGEATGILWTYYHEDGTRTVEEYDTSLDLVKETVYDASGNVISES